METDDDLYRRMGGEKHMNHMDVTNEIDVPVLVPRSQKPPARTKADFPNLETLREDIFGDPDVVNWPMCDLIEVALQASVRLFNNERFFKNIWDNQIHSLPFHSLHGEFRAFIYELQVRASAYNLSLAHCGMLYKALQENLDVEVDGHRLSQNNLEMQLHRLRLSRQSINANRLRLAREKDLARFDLTNNLYRDILNKVIREGQGQLTLCLEGEAGSGKTFILNTLIGRLYNQDKVVLATNATKGGLDTLMGGELFAERFRITKYALNDLDEHEMNLPYSEQRFLASVDLIIIDGCQRLPAQHFVLLDKLCRVVMEQPEVFMGGKHILMAADWAQPVDEARPSMRLLSRNRHFHQHMETVRLEGNKRWLSTGTPWSRFITNVATQHGYLDDVPLEIRQIPWTRGVDKSKCGLSELINFVYNNIEWQMGAGSGNATYFYNRVILTRQACLAEMINNYIVKQLPAGWFLQTSEAIDSRRGMEKSGRLIGPPYQLKLSPGMPLMLTENINYARGLLKGTLVYFDSLSTHTMKVKRRLVENNVFETIILAKVITIMQSNENWDDYPSKKFERLQFPVRPAFAQVLTKAEGKTYERVGILWSKEPTRVLHGELYLALSRVRHPKDLAICIPWHFEDLFRTPQHCDNLSILTDCLKEKFGLVNTVFNF